MENNELKEYFDKFDELPYLPMMASYNDDIYQYLLSMALLRGKPLTEDEINKAYDNKVDLVKEETSKDENEDAEMEEKRIRTLLKRYGADDREIDNFMEDLVNYKQESEEDEDFNYLDGDTMSKLKATEEGKDLIMNAPKMAKDELKKAIQDYLSK